MLRLLKKLCSVCSLEDELPAKRVFSSGRKKVDAISAVWIFTSVREPDK
jgi:hypothetical protein